ncbi:hypothetical protein B4U80_03786, partial [Leptotrombidium deliense]
MYNKLVNFLLMMRRRGTESMKCTLTPADPLLIKDVLMVPYYTVTALFVTTFAVVYKDFGLSRNMMWKQKLRTLA